MTTFSASSATIRWVAVMPSVPGIWTSMSTTSGRNASASSMAFSPSDASPTTSMSGSTDRIIRNPARTRSWSSTSNTLMGASAISTSSGERAVLRIERDADPDPESSHGPRADLALAAEQADPLADPGGPGPAGPRGLFRAPVVDHLELDRVAEVAQCEVRAARGRVLPDVGQRLLRDPVDRHGHRLRQLDYRTDLVEADLQAASVHLGDQCGQPVRACLRRLRVRRPDVDVGVRRAQHAEQLPHLVHGAAAGLLDHVQRVLRGVGVAVHHPAGAA